MSRINLPLITAALFISGCAAAPLPSVTAAHPASADGREGAHPAAHSSLRADELTRSSRAELSAAAKAQSEWDEHGPVSGTSADENAPVKPNALPGMDHEKMKGMNHDNP
jgi:hypothetical protein